MRLTRLAVTNYRALRDVSIPLSHFGCLIGENDSGKSSFLQALSLFFSGSKLPASRYFDELKPIRIEVTIEDIWYCPFPFRIATIPPGGPAARYGDRVVITRPWMQRLSQRDMAC